MAQIILSKEDIIRMSRKEYGLGKEIDCTIIEDTQTVDLEEKPKDNKVVKSNLAHLIFKFVSFISWFTFIFGLVAISITCLILLFRNIGLIGL